MTLRIVTCDVCKQPVPQYYTFDFWASVTIHSTNEDGHDKAGEPAPEFSPDYYAVGPCCEDKAKKAWAAFHNVLIGE